MVEWRSRPSLGKEEEEEEVVVDTRCLLSCLFHGRNKVGVPGKSEGVLFCPVPVEVTYFEPERVGVELLNRTVMADEGITSMNSDLVHIADMLASVEEVLDRLLGYVQDVIVSRGGGGGGGGREMRRRRRGNEDEEKEAMVHPVCYPQDGKIPPNSAVGRLLMETVSMVPQIDSSHFEQMMNSAMQVIIVGVVRSYGVYTCHTIVMLSLSLSLPPSPSPRIS